MAFRFDLDHANRILLLTIGELTDRTLLEAYIRLRGCCDHYGSLHCIVDYSHLTKVSITGFGATYLSEREPIVGMDCLMFNVAPQEEIFGMARMYQMLASEKCPNFYVVRTLPEALEIVGVKSPTFNCISPAPWQPSLDRERAA